MADQEMIHPSEPAPLDASSWINFLLTGNTVSSPTINSCYRSVVNILSKTQNDKTKKVIQEIIRKPIPLCILALDIDDQKRAADFLLRRGYISSTDELIALFGRIKKTVKKVIPLLAPGSDSSSHNCYPGGLVVHTYFNLHNGMALVKSHSRLGAFEIDKDRLIWAIVLHDLMKPCILTWDEHFHLPGEPLIACTKAHHIVMIAEAMYRRLPPILVQYIAAIHAESIQDKESVVRYIRAAEIIARRNAVEEGILEKTKSGDFRLRGGINIDHLIANTSEQGFRSMALEQSATIQSEVSHYLGCKYDQLNNQQVNTFNKLVRFCAPDFILYGILTKNGYRAFEDTIDAIIRERLERFLRL